MASERIPTGKARKSELSSMGKSVGRSREKLKGRIGAHQEREATKKTKNGRSRFMVCLNQKITKITWGEAICPDSVFVVRSTFPEIRRGSFLYLSFYLTPWNHNSAVWTKTDFFVCVCFCADPKLKILRNYLKKIIKKYICSLSVRSNCPSEERKVICKN